MHPPRPPAGFPKSTPLPTFAPRKPPEGSSLALPVPCASLRCLFYSHVLVLRDLNDSYLWTHRNPLRLTSLSAGMALYRYDTRQLFALLYQ